MPTNCCQQKLLKYGEQTYKPWKSIDSLSLQLSYTSYVEVTIIIQNFMAMTTPLKHPSPRKLRREHTLPQVFLCMIY